jgi:O-antigen/teichoic acid export membrane protein
MLRRLLEGRALQIGLTIGAGWGGRGASALAQFVAVRILTTMLGVEGFGAWAVITGLLAWFMLADFGLGAALQNHVSAGRVSGEDAAAAMRGTVSFLWRTLLLLFLLFAVVSPWAGPFLLEGFAGIGQFDATIAFLVFATIAAATGASSIALKISFAEHRGYLAHAITAAGAVLGLIGMMVVADIAPPHKLAWALAANYLPLFLLSVCSLWMRFRHLPPQQDTSWKRGIRPLRAQAGHFLLFATLSALVLNVDYIVLARTVSPEDVATYAVFTKLYALVFFVFSSVLQVYWPISSEAFQRGDVDKLHSLLIKCIGFGVVVVVLSSIALLLLNERIAEILSPDRPLVLPTFLIPYFAGYWILRIWSDTFSMLVLSAGRASFLCLVVPVQAAVSLGLGAWGAVLFGLPGFILGLATSFLVTVVWVLPLYVRSLAKRRLEGSI